MFWDASPTDKKIFVADPKEGWRHHRGWAVDLTLVPGKPAEMVGVYDEMSERSYPACPGSTSLQRGRRRLLRHAMEDEGFRYMSLNSGTSITKTGPRTQS